MNKDDQSGNQSVPLADTEAASTLAQMADIADEIADCLQANNDVDVDAFVAQYEQ